MGYFRLAWNPCIPPILFGTHDFINPVQNPPPVTCNQTESGFTKTPAHSGAADSLLCRKTAWTSRHLLETSPFNQSLFRCVVAQLQHLSLHPRSRLPGGHGRSTSLGVSGRSQNGCLTSIEKETRPPPPVRRRSNPSRPGIGEESPKGRPSESRAARR